MQVLELWYLRADHLLGEGSFGRVYKATRVVTGQIMAVKKSRASLALKTTLLNHERRVLQRLQGHPSIPRVIAYGRLVHFEYLAMQLLGMNLSEVRGRCPLPAVNTLAVADQMISALEHIHANKLVHCDIKPGNIILHPTDSKRLYLVDYGLTRAIAHEVQPNLSTDAPLTSHVIGTLEYVSLNIHRHIRSAPRDDIESLGYTLLSLARGDLPWTYNTQHGTRKNQEVQVRIKKQQFSGADMAPDGLPCFGQMIDYARSLKFNQLPDYELLRLQIQETRALAGLLDPAKINWNIPAEVLSDSPSCPLTCVDTISLCPGQIVCCQIDVRTTLEGYSARAGDPLFWRDPSLSPEKWDTAVRPAVVLRVGIDERSKLQSIVVICIGQGVLSSTDMNVVPISSSPTEGSLTPSPAWPLSDSYCYIFPWLMRFVCYPGEELHILLVQPVPSPWTISKTDVDLLLQKFDNHTFADTLPLRDRFITFQYPFVKITAFGPDFSRGNGEGMPIEWGGYRAWYDEWQTVKERREKLDQGSSDYKRALPESYFASDFEQWGGYQMELSSSVTAGVDDNGDTGLPVLPVIAEVEMSRDVRFTM
ncbi:kinase-like domain-containing protein [Suillus fuscotomentosus]|uniref:non-specific serine/threonine protein kinase n=1 Tax=Suillus fuscotomentosus TaxID=1912939 RepID=A0AAD4HND0_9AGAM|nr:kinase-like domain-containing protein [Suillus fuscotomentosus]KAG1902983.1 kinase-like domain-containing protein [Suillus fuscotomentosus]